MKQILKISFSAITFILAIVLTVMSTSPYEGKIFLFSIILIAFGGLVISLTWATWTNRNWKTTFKDSFKVSFGISSLIFVLGYLYTGLQPIILK